MTWASVFSTKRVSFIGTWFGRAMRVVEGGRVGWEVRCIFRLYSVLCAITCVSVMLASGLLLSLLSAFHQPS